MQLLMRATGAFSTRTPADLDCNANTLLTDSDNGKRIGVKRGWAFNYLDQLQVISGVFPPEFKYSISCIDLQWFDIKAGNS
jgi:hypothetical protein